MTEFILLVLCCCVQMQSFAHEKLQCEKGGGGVNILSFGGLKFGSFDGPRHLIVAVICSSIAFCIKGVNISKCRRVSLR